MNCNPDNWICRCPSQQKILNYHFSLISSNLIWEGRSLSNTTSSNFTYEKVKWDDTQVLESLALLAVKSPISHKKGILFKAATFRFHKNQNSSQYRSEGKKLVKRLSEVIGITVLLPTKNCVYSTVYIYIFQGNWNTLLHKVQDRYSKPRRPEKMSSVSYTNITKYLQWLHFKKEI